MKREFFPGWPASARRAAGVIDQMSGRPLSGCSATSKIVLCDIGPC